jgi:hypothetical protein
LKATFNPTRSKLAQGWQGFLILQFIDSSADDPIQFQQLIDGRILNPHD